LKTKNAGHIKSGKGQKLTSFNTENERPVSAEIRKSKNID